MTDDLRRFPDYEIFGPPEVLADRTPREWTAAEAKEYLQWFLQAIPDRLLQLKVALRSEPSAAASVELDFSPESLGPLGAWYRGAMTAYQKTEEELARELAALPEKIRRMGRPGWTLTRESLSIAVDVGIYLGETFTRRFPNLHWSLRTSPKSDASYNQPVLEGGATNVEPIHLAVVLAYGIARGTKGSDDLSRLFRFWEDRLDA